MMKAAVIEDEILIREGLCKLMEKMFPEIEISGVVGNGQEGLSCILKYKPDLIITDIKMSGMDGLAMLSRVQEMGIFPRVIVLTAYSEFTYAQQAVKLGVCDYVIKPVVVQEFVRTIRKIQNLYEQEQKKTPETMGSLEHIVSGILYGTAFPEEHLSAFLDKKYGISQDTPIMELLIYLGEGFETGRERKRREMCRLLERKEIKYCLVDMEYDKAILVLLYQYTSRQEIECWYQKLLPYMDWNIVLGNEILISYPRIADIQTEVCNYPVELENQMKIAICAGEKEYIREMVNRFQDYFSDGRVYSPKGIKESYVRFLWSVLNIAKEVDCIDYKKVDQKRLLDRIMSAKTEGELKKSCEELLCHMNVSDRGMETVSLTVKKRRA